MKSFPKYLNFLFGSVVIVNLSLVRSNSEVEAISSSFEIKHVISDDRRDCKREYCTRQYLFNIIGGASEETIDSVETNPLRNDSNSIKKSADTNEDSSQVLTTANDLENDTQQREDKNISEMNKSSDKNPPTVEIMIEKSSDNKDSLELHSKASALRSDGKYLHDNGKFSEAASTFEKAVSLLDEALRMSNDEKMSTEMAEERATCRLHEALCYLKEKKHPAAIRICTDVLRDGVQVIEVNNNMEEAEDGLVSEDDNPNPYLIRVSPESKKTAEVSDKLMQLSPAVRARAYHRRAKARLALDDTTGALEDAKAAAFLGDRNAVALYGKLMRESGSHQSIFGEDDFGKGYGNESLADLLSSQGDGHFDSIFPGNSPASGLGLFGSLMNGSGSSTIDSPFGGLGSILSNGKDGSDIGSLAKSVLVSMSKRIEDKSTQESICKYLNAVNTAQLMSLSSIAGIPLNESTADRLVSFANSMTPQRMMKSVKLFKRIMFLGGLVRKIFMIIGKYKHLIILLLLIQWCKSSVTRPIVIKNAAKKTIESVNKAAFMI